MRMLMFIKLPGGELQSAVNLLDGNFYAQLAVRRSVEYRCMLRWISTEWTSWTTSTKEIRDSSAVLIARVCRGAERAAIGIGTRRATSAYKNPGQREHPSARRTRTSSAPKDQAP